MRGIVHTGSILGKSEALRAFCDGHQQLLLQFFRTLVRWQVQLLRENCMVQIITFTHGISRKLNKTYLVEASVGRRKQAGVAVCFVNRKALRATHSLQVGKSTQGHLIEQFIKIEDMFRMQIRREIKQQETILPCWFQ